MGHDVLQWVREDEVRRSIEDRRVNELFLPGIELPDSLAVTGELDEALGHSTFIVFSVPSQFLRSVLLDSAPLLDNAAVLVNTAKGIELSTLKLLSEVFAELLGPGVEERLAVLSGPSFAREVARGKPTAVSIASRRLETAEHCQKVFSNPSFRAYATDDVIGLEVGGSLKNVIAIAAGIVDGLGLGPNSLSALITRGLAEITRLGVSMGARPETFSGLGGLGDLVLTATEAQSRNRTLGYRIGSGESLDDILLGMNTVAEGVKTSKAALEISRRLGIDMPITEKVTEVLFENKPPLEAIDELMSRELKHEHRLMPSKRTADPVPDHQNKN